MVNALTQAYRLFVGAMQAQSVVSSQITSCRQKRKLDEFAHNGTDNRFTLFTITTHSQTPETVRY
jgi:hypothetical protein